MRWLPATMYTLTGMKPINRDVKLSKRGIRITTWRCCRSILSVINRRSVPEAVTLNVPSKNRKRPSPCTPSSENLPGSRENAIHPNTNNGWHAVNSIRSCTMPGCWWEKHNSRKETFRKQPLLSHTSRDSTPDNPKSRQMPVFGLPNATHRWGGIMMRKMFCKKWTMTAFRLHWLRHIPEHMDTTCWEANVTGKPFPTCLLPSKTKRTNGKNPASIFFWDNYTNCCKTRLKHIRPMERLSNSALPMRWNWTRVSARRNVFHMEN